MDEQNSVTVRTEIEAGKPRKVEIQILGKWGIAGSVFAILLYLIFS